MSTEYMGVDIISIFLLFAAGVNIFLSHYNDMPEACQGTYHQTH